MEKIPDRQWTWGNALIGYDPVKRRVWLAGQRLHHGLTGALVAGAGIASLATHKRSGLQWTLVGTMLMAHDWKDRSIWFERGPGHQP